MTGIQSRGIGSGLDIQSIVTQLVAAEGAPVESQLARREAAVQSELSAFGSLRSALSNIKTAADNISSLEQILSRKVSVGNEDVFTATVDTDAVPGRYSVEVVNTASAQKLISGAFADQTTAVGTGTLTIAYGSDTFELNLEAGNNSLSDIRDAINASPDNTGVAASIVNAEDGSYLVLSGDKTGNENTITITEADGDGGLAALTYDSATATGALTQTEGADDARIRIDGLLVQSATNDFDTAINGVSISVLRGSDGSAFDLSVENDVSQTAGKISAFVNSYNALIDLNRSLTAFDQESGVAGTLLGDSTLRGIVTQIRRELTTAVDGVSDSFSLLGDIGIELQVDGKFEINSGELNDALAGNFSQIAQLFVSENGFATRVAETADELLASDSTLQIRTDGLDAQVERINEQRERLQDRLVVLEERLFRQYNALDSLLAELNSTSSFLQSQFANLPGFTRNSD